MKPKSIDCPACGHPLGTYAKFCGCGWRRVETTDTNQRRGTDCAHEGCPNLAQIRQRTPTGWANLCDPHYIAFHRARAAAWCHEHGLDRYPDESQTDWRHRCLEYVSLMGKGKARGHISEYLRGIPRTPHDAPASTQRLLAHLDTNPEPGSNG